MGWEIGAFKVDFQSDVTNTTKVRRTPQSAPCLLNLLVIIVQLKFSLVWE
jgi:hypothetical protein